ncbi:hypothetical protein AAG906_020791 [Vitis piasezkii]
MDAWRGVEREKVREKGDEEENEELGIEGERWTAWKVCMDMRARVYKRGEFAWDGYVLMNGYHGGSHACMIPMHVGGWLWDSYGDEHGMVREMRQPSGQRGDGVGSIKVVDLGKSPPANAPGWNYMNACVGKLQPRSDVPWLYQE